MPENVFGRKSVDVGKTIWIPTAEHALEDGLLMIALHVLKDRELVNLSEKHFGNMGVDQAELYKDIGGPQLAELREKTRAVRGDYKVVITTLRDSALEQQLTVLKHYKMDVEVCVPVYSRVYSRWSNRTRNEGSLD